MKPFTETLGGPAKQDTNQNTPAAPTENAFWRGVRKVAGAVLPDAMTREEGATAPGWQSEGDARSYFLGQQEPQPQGTLTKALGTPPVAGQSTVLGSQPSFEQSFRNSQQMTPDGQFVKGDAGTAILGNGPATGSYSTIGRMMDTGMSSYGVRAMDAINNQTLTTLGQAGNGMLDNRGRSFDEQVAFANKVNADSARQLATQMSPKEAAEAMIAKDTNRSEVTRANAAAGAVNATARLGAYNTMQAQNTELAKSQNTLTGNQYDADKRLAGTKLTADAHVKSAELGAYGLEAAASVKAKANAQEKSQKDYADNIKKLTDDWSKLHVPIQYVPRMNEFAKIYTEAQDPKGNVFMMAPNRDGGMYAALPKAYESHYQNLLQTMPHKEASARIYQVAKGKGEAVDVPDFNRFVPKAEAIKATKEAKDRQRYGG